jgi:hypothetical protein
MHLYYENVNHALYTLPAMMAFAPDILTEESRNGPVLSWPAPVTLTTTKPTERVCFCPIRRCNPFLFLLDGLSILIRDDRVAPLAQIAPRFLQYSDNGVDLRGHYGKRLFRQISRAVQMLMEDHTTRRVTMSIWDWTADLAIQSKDIPCNVHVNLRIINGALDLTVFNRSNDLFWGMIGANIVQFSFLQEFMANAIGVQVGNLHQISTNLHIYTEFGPGKGNQLMKFSPPPKEYPPVRVLNVTGLRDELLRLWGELAEDQPISAAYDNPFMADIVIPMMLAWQNKDPSYIGGIWDWHVAGRQYLAGGK